MARLGSDPSASLARSGVAPRATSLSGDVGTVGREPTETVTARPLLQTIRFASACFGFTLGRFATQQALVYVWLHLYHVSGVVTSSAFLAITLVGAVAEVLSGMLSDTWLAASAGPRGRNRRAAQAVLYRRLASVWCALLAGVWLFPGLGTAALSGWVVARTLWTLVLLLMMMGYAAFEVAVGANYMGIVSTVYPDSEAVVHTSPLRQALSALGGGGGTVLQVLLVAWPSIATVAPAMVCIVVTTSMYITISAMQEILSQQGCAVRGRVASARIPFGLLFHKARAVCVKALHQLLNPSPLRSLAASLFCSALFRASIMAGAPYATHLFSEADQANLTLFDGALFAAGLAVPAYLSIPMMQCLVLRYGAMKTMCGAFLVRACVCACLTVLVRSVWWLLVLVVLFGVTCGADLVTQDLVLTMAIKGQLSHPTASQGATLRTGKPPQALEGGLTSAGLLGMCTRLGERIILVLMPMLLSQTGAFGLGFVARFSLGWLPGVSILVAALLLQPCVKAEQARMGTGTTLQPRGDPGDEQGAAPHGSTA